MDPERQWRHARLDRHQPPPGFVVVSWDYLARFLTRLEQQEEEFSHFELRRLGKDALALFVVPLLVAVHLNNEELLGVAVLVQLFGRRAKVIGHLEAEELLHRLVVLLEELLVNGLLRLLFLFIPLLRFHLVEPKLPPLFQAHPVV